MGTTMDVSLDPDNPRLLRAGILLRNLNEAPAALRGFLATVDTLGNFFNPHGHRNDKLQSWLTHSSVVLLFEGDQRVWRLERPGGVKNGFKGGSHINLLPDEKLNDFQWLHRERVCSDVVCNIAHELTEFEGKTMADVQAFVLQQSSHKYHVLAKNCQHLCYDFYRYCLHHKQAMQMEYPDFNEMLQSEFSKH